MDNNCVHNTLEIPSPVTEADNQMLLHFPFCVEIKNVVFALNGDGHQVWMGLVDTFIKPIGILLVQMQCSPYKNFFKVVYMLPNNTNSKMIVLILKIPCARAMGDYCPIALANFHFKIISKILWIVGTGERIHFWTDNWLGAPLVDLIHLDSDFHGHLYGTVSEVIVNGSWQLPATLKHYGDIKDRLEATVLPTSQLPDVFVWPHAPDGILTSKHALSFLSARSSMLPWAEHIWRASIPPSHSCIYWCLHHGKMPTNEKIKNHGYIVVSICSLCLAVDESSDHFFFRCQFARQLWDWIGFKLNCVIDCSSVDTILSCRPPRCSSQVSDIYLEAILNTLHTIWWARNSLRFQQLNQLCIQPMSLFILVLQCPVMFRKVSACALTSAFLILFRFLLTTEESKKLFWFRGNLLLLRG